MIGAFLSSETAKLENLCMLFIQRKSVNQGSAAGTGCGGWLLFMEWLPGHMESFMVIT
jgi:hypothetical protein